MKEYSVLFVDDDINVLSSLKRGLIDEDYQSFFATSGDKALAIMEENDISIIVTDMRMPGMDGLKLLKIVEEKYPLVVKIVLTGYTQLPQILATVNQVNIFKFITKPWKLEEEFKVIIRQAIEQYKLLREKEQYKEALKKRDALYKNILRETDEKIKNNKKSFDSIKEINRYIFNILKKQLQKGDISDAEKAIQAMENMYEEYAVALSSEIIEFDLEKLETDLRSWFINHNIDKWVKMEIINNKSCSVRGNYNLILFIVTLLIKHLFDLAGVYSVNLQINFIENEINIITSIDKSEKSLSFIHKKCLEESITISFLESVCEVAEYYFKINLVDANSSFELKITV